MRAVSLLQGSPRMLTLQAQCDTMLGTMEIASCEHLLRSLRLRLATFSERMEASPVCAAMRTRWYARISMAYSSRVVAVRTTSTGKLKARNMLAYTRIEL